MGNKFRTWSGPYGFADHLIAKVILGYRFNF